VQKFEIYESLWGMQLCNPNLPERSDEELDKAGRRDSTGPLTSKTQRGGKTTKRMTS